MTKKDEIDKLLAKKEKKISSDIAWERAREDMFRVSWSKNNSVRNAVARDLGISRVQVWRLAKRFGLS